MKNLYWIVTWLEKWPDGTVNGFRTAIKSTTLTRAARIAKAELTIRTTAYQKNVHYLITNIGLGDEDAAGLVGKSEADVLAIDWPE